MTSLEAIHTVPLPPPDRARSAPREEPAPQPFTRFLEALGLRIDSGEHLVQSASAGRYANLDAGQLIALQAGIYRYSEAVDLGAKLVDRTANSVRAVLQAGH